MDAMSHTCNIRSQACLYICIYEYIQLSNAIYIHQTPKCHIDEWHVTHMQHVRPGVCMCTHIYINIYMELHDVSQMNDMSHTCTYTYTCNSNRGAADSRGAVVYIHMYAHVHTYTCQYMYIYIYVHATLIEGWQIVEGR